MMLLLGFAILAAPISPNLALDWCTYNGVTYKYGDVFTLPGDSKCIKYKCELIGIFFYSGGCEVNGECHPFGSTFLTQCRNYYCSETKTDKQHYYSTSVLSTQCPDVNGVCRNPGDVFSYVIDGITYLQCGCKISSTTGDIHYSCKRPCAVKDVTYQNGEIFTIPGQSKCVKYVCNSGQYSLIEDGCEADGVCHPVDSTWTVNCLKYKCSKSEQTDRYLYSQSVVSFQCPDVNGTCHESGEMFPNIINGKYSSQCTCLVYTSGEERYNCEEPVNNASRNTGEIYPHLISNIMINVVMFYSFI